MSSIPPSSSPSPDAQEEYMIREDGLIILSLSLIAALILFSYAVARGPSESLFLRDFNPNLLPGLWIEVGVAVIAVVSIYNRALKYLSLNAIFQLSFLLTGLSLAGLVYMDWGGPSEVIELFGLSFPWGRVTLIRIWCDLYIVVLVETFWSLANLHFPLKTAKTLYGWLCAAGTLGSMVGNRFVSAYAETYTTERLITLVVPTAILMSLVALPLARMKKRSVDRERPLADSEGKPLPPAEPQWSLSQGLKIIHRSQYLIWILTLVLLSQVVVTLIDYQYKSFLKEAYTDVDTRSAIQGLVYFSIDIGSLIMQLITGFTLTALGVGRTLFIIPCLLGALCVAPMLSPLFIAIAAAKSSSKFLTYSIFKSAKEILYLPLNYMEQTQGKAVIDILVYRQAKILASALLIVFSAFSVSLIVVQWLTLVCLFGWIFVALKLWSKTKNYDNLD